MNTSSLMIIVMIKEKIEKIHVNRITRELIYSNVTLCND